VSKIVSKKHARKKREEEEEARRRMAFFESSGIAAESEKKKKKKKKKGQQQQTSLKSFFVAQRDDDGDDDDDGGKNTTPKNNGAFLHRQSRREEDVLERKKENDVVAFERAEETPKTGVDEEGEEEDDDDEARRRRGMKCDEMVLTWEKKRAKTETEDDLGRRVRKKIREDDKDEEEEEEEEGKRIAIPERDARLRERFNAKLVAKATTANSARDVRGRSQAFKKQREEHGNTNDDDENVLDEIEPRDKKLTPLETQVRDFKAKHPTVLLLFEVGYKFHFYGKDARKAAETLNVFAYPGKTWLQASGPVHRLPVYVKRLVNAGHKVGVVRQTETAALKAEGSTKGSVFTRELVALYTKATIDAGVSIAADPVNNNESSEAQRMVENDDKAVGAEWKGAVDNKAGEELEGMKNERKNSASTTADKQCRLSNYLLCISEEEKSERGNKDEIALVAIETSVGNIYHAHFEDDSSRSRLESALLKISPCEILFAGGGGESSSSKETKRLISALFPDSRVEYSNSVTSSLSKAEIDEYFGPINSEKVAHLPRLLIATLAATREYLIPFKLENVLKLSKAIKPLDDVQSEMILSPNAIRQLEIFRNSDDGSFTGSLLWLIDHAKSKAGSRELSRWVSRPLRDRTEIENRLSAIQALREMNSVPASVIALEKIEKTLRTAPDVERVVARAHHLNATPAEFVAAMQFFLSFGAACVEMQHSLLSKGAENSPLNELLSACADEATLRACTKALNALDLTVANSKAGNLGCSRDAYVGLFLKENEDNQKQFPEVFQAHDNLEKSKSTMDALLPDLASQIPGIIKGSKLSYTSVGGASGAEYLIEVSDKLKPPNDWIKVSANKSKKVIRYHPPIVLEKMKALEANSERLALACECAWKSFLKEFSRVSYGECRQASKATAKIDALNALAILSMNDGYCRPEFLKEEEENADGTARIEIVDGRHPTLDAKMVDKFVPNSASLGGQSNESNNNNNNTRCRRAIILTGPNMGGKSCFARQVALIAILAHIGSYVPAQSCRLSVLDGIYTRAGAADNLALGQSTFFQEMSETSAILKSCTKKSLVVLDELGRGTSTSDGIALASATLRMLVEKVQCATVFVTHFSNLAKQFKESNACDVFCCFPAYMKTNDVKDSKRITFLYTLEEGVAHRSFGLNVASMAGIPGKVLEVAEKKSLAFEENDSQISAVNNAVTDGMIREALLETSNVAEIEKTQRALRLCL